MDIYEFTQVLWRRRWLLLLGLAVVMILVALMSLDFSNGIRFKSNPKFEAQVQMAVVPEGFEALSQDLGANSLAAPANMFSSLLTSPQAALEIQEQEGVPVLALEITSSGRDRFFWVTALSTTPDGAVEAALGSFTWLEQRLSQPLVTASAPNTSQPAPPLLDEEGKFRGSVRLELDHGLAADSEGLWLVTQTHSDDEFAFRLSDAAAETTAEYISSLTPGAPISILLEDATGSPLDSVSVELPPLPAGEASSYELVIGLDRGLVRGTIVASELDGIRTIADPKLDSDRVRLVWQPVTSPSDDAVNDELEEVSILLLTDEPIPASIGGRRAPLLIVAMVTAGVVALIVFTVVVDSWSQERRRHAGVLRDDSPASVPQPIPLSGQGAPDERHVGS